MFSCAGCATSPLAATLVRAGDAAAGRPVAVWPTGQRAGRYILNEQEGIWNGGIWYSNDGYLPLPLARWTLPKDSRWDWPPWDRPRWDRLDHTLDRCGFCGTIIDLTANECQYCGWCLDCGEMPEDCLCYTPAALDKRIGTAGNTRRHR